MNDAWSEAPNSAYQKFFEDFSAIDALPVSKWKPQHVLSYFCKKYADAYKNPYPFKFNTEKPKDCFEMFNIKKLSSSISKDPEILKAYVDFVFETKGSKKKITSIAFLSHEDVMFEYKKNYLFQSKTFVMSETISRSKELPIAIKQIFPHLETYGDLAFLSMIEPKTPDVISGFEKLTQITDPNFLKRII